MSEKLTLPVLPLDEGVVLPGMIVPLTLDDSDVRAAVEAAQAGTDGPGRVLVVPRPDGRYAELGTVATIDQVGRLPGGQAAVVVRGIDRARIGAGTTGPGAALWVEAAVLDAETTHDDETLELARTYKALVVTLLQQRGAFQFVDSIQRITDPSQLADTAGYAPYLSDEQKHRVLTTLDVKERLELVAGWAREHLAELDVAETIRKDVQEGMDKQQREFLLRKQLAAVRKELAELDPTVDTEEKDYRARVEAADLPEKVAKAALAEVDKLERTSEQSPEVGWIRTWLDTVLEMPWNERTDDEYDVAGAREILDADHAGLTDVKDRIIEYLAVRRRRADRGLGVVGGRRSGAVLALV
ncbi:MAG TPA: LON peptidase substrate-binding domain-containing protein, partial [Mycobacteriales bacterium]|nr:LON peptidase substrate-binding domain-containing protein [Mycobacteriales bacterium]